MGDFNRFTMKIKQSDGSYKKYSPTVTLDSVITDDGKSLSTKFTDNGEKFNGVAASADAVAWSGISNTPTSLSGYGITNAYSKTESNNLYVAKTDVTTTATANKLLQLDNNAKIPANILSGVIPIDNIPHGAMERCVVVANDTARFALTNSNVQVGDTVKVTSTGKMYFIIDSTKLNTEAGYEIYTAGSASSVAWSGVQNKPTTLSGYGITDAVNSSEIVTSPTANKLLKLDDTGKFPIGAIPQHIQFTTYTLSDIT